MTYGISNLVTSLCILDQIIIIIISFVVTLGPVCASCSCCSGRWNCYRFHIRRLLLSQLVSLDWKSCLFVLKYGSGSFSGGWRKKSISWKYIVCEPHGGGGEGGGIKVSQTIHLERRGRWIELPRILFHFILWHVFAVIVPLNSVRKAFW